MQKVLSQSEYCFTPTYCRFLALRPLFLTAQLSMSLQSVYLVHTSQLCEARGQLAYSFLTEHTFSDFLVVAYLTELK